MPKVRPVTPVWRVFMIGKSARVLGFALAVIDGMISYKGMRNMGYPQMEATTIAVFIAVFQAVIAYLLTSGAPIGQDLEKRFFSDGGVTGLIRRVIGVILILLCIAFYAADIATNYAAFMGTSLLPDTTIPELTRSLFAVMSAVALSLGDEILHLLADIADANGDDNERTSIERHGPDQLMLNYQRSYMVEAHRKAQEQGKQRGQAWKPSGRRDSNDQPEQRT